MSDNIINYREFNGCFNDVKNNCCIINRNNGFLQIIHRELPVGSINNSKQKNLDLIVMTMHFYMI